MKKLFNLYLSIAYALCIFNAEAKTIDAPHALAHSLSELASLTQTNAGLFDLQLVGNREYNGKTTLYIFSSPTTYVIASADDNAPVLLAYSLDGGFSPEIPPSMKWWLEQYSESIGRLDDRYVKNTPPDESRPPIQPMTTTKWDQSEPFNNSCPTHDGRTPLTGCVATAMAQIMRYHQWPVKGVGSIQWTCERDYRFHDHFYDFDSVTFDWENMIDSYDDDATQTQENAVAELMRACGAASQMQYGYYASGSYPYTAARGLIKYLKYDRGMEYLDSRWFASIDDWDSICYAELSEGRPILYGGENDISHSRHSFVMDGYSEEGLYHINWGWGGKNNGFFKLNNFSYPGGNYRLNHTMVRGIKPLDESSDFVPAMSMARQFTTDKTEYEKKPGTEIRFFGDFQSESLDDIWIWHGVKCVPTDGSPEFYVSHGNAQWYRPRSINVSYTIPAEDFPAGIYDLYPVFKSETTDWLPCYQDQTNKGKGVRFEVSETSINSGRSGLQDILVDTPGNGIYYDLYGNQVLNPCNGIFIKVTDGIATKIAL